MVLALAVLDPSLGSLVMEVGFPFLGVWILLRKTGDRFAPSVLFPAIYLFWFWLGTIPILVYDRVTAATSSINDRVWFYCLLGLIGYLSGTLVVRSHATDDSRLRDVRGAWQERHLLLFFSALAVGIVVTWLSIVASEGIPVFRADIDTLRLEIPERHRFPFQVMVGLSNLMMPLIFLYIWSSRQARFRKCLYFFSGLIVLMIASLGNRGLVLPSLLTIFALRHYLVKRWPVRYIVTAGLVILPVLSISGYYRSLQHFGPTYVIDLLNMGLPVPLQPFTNIYLYVRAPVETFRHVLAVIPSVTSYQQGGLTFGFLAQLLPGRHPSSDFFFKNLLGHTFEGFGEPASILGTFYADFGPLGVVTGMFCVGVLIKALHVQMFQGSLGWLLAYCFLWQKLIEGLYGSLFTYVIEIILPVTWIIAVWLLTSGTVPRRDRIRSGA